MCSYVRTYLPSALYEFVYMYVLWAYLLGMSCLSLFSTEYVMHICMVVTIDVTLRAELHTCLEAHTYTYTVELGSVAQYRVRSLQSVIALVYGYHRKGIVKGYGQGTDNCIHS